ncbi:MAG TPA: glycosyltransferase family 2 protein [Armatimonadota bacterium]|nr:glycosyltransferase family 2 protein [Armatimonadota bacterium]
MAREPDVGGKSFSGHKPLVGVLIVTRNRKADVLECVEAVMRSSYRHRAVYVVDNASTDGSSQAIAEQYPDVRVIRSGENLGFAGGNNLGMAGMLDDGVDAVFLINDDAVVAQDGLEKLVDGLRDSTVAVVSPKVLLHGEPGVIWSAGGRVDPRTGVSVQRHYGEADRGQADEVAEIDYAIGCAMLVSADVIRRVGLMDSRYFMYYEEADWCRRIRHADYRIMYVPQSRVWHKVIRGGDGRNHAAYYFCRNRLLYLRSAGVPASRIAWVALSDILRSAAVHAVKGRAHQSRLMIQGVMDYYTGTFGEFRDGS